MAHTIPAALGEYETVEKKSRFLGFCAYCESGEQAKVFLSELRKKHYEARHVCYAWRIEGAERSSDDGEPRGTAGSPILAVLRGAGLEYSICAVVRYFGGTLLGTGGLTRAYGEAAKGAVAAAGSLVREKMARIYITVDYPLEPPVRKLCEGYETSPVYAGNVTLEVSAPANEAERLSLRVRDLTRGKAEILISEV